MTSVRRFSSNRGGPYRQLSLKCKIDAKNQSSRIIAATASSAMIRLVRAVHTSQLQDYWFYQGCQYRFKPLLGLYYYSTRSNPLARIVKKVAREMSHLSCFCGTLKQCPLETHHFCTLLTNTIAPLVVSTRFVLGLDEALRDYAKGFEAV